MMTTAPIQTMRAATRAATRIRAARALRGGGLGLVVGGAGAILGVAAAKWLALSGAGSLWVLGVCAGGGLLTGLVAGGLRRVGAGAGAGRLDEFLGLEDRLRTAVELEETGVRSGFAALAIADAEARAPGVRVTSATPLRMDRTWAIGAGVLLAAVGVWFLAPMRETPTPGLLAASSPESRREADARLERVIEDLREVSADEPQNPETARAIAEIESLRERLEQGRLRSEDALAAAAAALERAAEEAGARSEREAETERAIADAARSVADEGEAEAKELARTLAEGDLDRALEAARRMREASRGMPPEVRDRLAKDLERLGDALEQAKPAEPPVSSADRDLAERLQERVEDLTDRDAVAEALREEGLDRASAEDLAERIAREESAREHRERTREEIERMREALREVSGREPEKPETDRPGDAGDTPGEKPVPEETGKDADGAHEDGESTERPGERPPSPGAQDRSGQAPTEQSTGEPDPKRTEPGERPSGQPGDQAGEQPGEKPGEKPGEQPGEKPGEQPGEKPGQQPGQQPGEQPGGQPGERTEGDDRGAREGEATRSEGEPVESAGDREGAPRRDGDGSGEGDAPPGSGAAGEGGTLEEMLERMKERRSRRTEDQRLSEDLRRRAQELLDQATPEQRQRLEEWAREEVHRRAHSPGSLGEAGEEVVDARSRERDESGRVISEWFNPEGEAPAGVLSDGVSGEQLKEAAAAAERAVEQQRVPTRYRRLVRDVFKRVQERGEKGGIAPLSEDAGG